MEMLLERYDKICLRIHGHMLELNADVMQEVETLVVLSLAKELLNIL